MRFVGTYPALSAELAALKLAYFAAPNPAAAALALLALLGGALAAWRQRLLLIPLGMALAYALPFALMIPYYYRYRLPIESALAVPAGAALGMLIERLLPAPKSSTPA